jgi:ABC-2 type transport system ATP-binding protein
MRKMGGKELRIELTDRLDVLPPALAGQGLELVDGGDALRYEYDAEGGRTSIAPVLSALNDAGIRFRDLDTAQRSLEDIFVHLVGEAK